MTELVHTGFWGVTGVGKSYEVKRRLSTLPSRASRVVVISPVDEFTSSSPDPQRRGPLKDAMTLTELKRDPMKLFEPHLALALYGFDPLRPEQPAAAVKLVARLQSRYKLETGKPPRPFLLVLDECGPYARHCLRELEGLATLGGQHLGITIWAITQRPQLVPTTLRSQMKRLVLWHMEQPADLEAASERAHEPELVDKLLELPATFEGPDSGPYFVEIEPKTKSSGKKSLPARVVAKPHAPQAEPPPPAAHPSPPANPNNGANAS